LHSTPLARGRCCGTLRKNPFGMARFRQIDLAKAVRLFCGKGWLLLLMLVAEVRAQDFTFTNINGAICITGTTTYSGLAGSVIIPSTINGLPVVSIGAAAFLTNFYLTSVTIPRSVTNIGAIAFQQCYALTNLALPDGPTTVGFGAFHACERLTSVTIPNGFTNIGTNAFSSCSGLRNVIIPSSVITIDDSAFNGCSGLTNVTIPDSVTYIGAGAFLQCNALINVTIPGSVTNIGEAAFFWCGNLTGVYFKSNAPGLGPVLLGPVFEGDSNTIAYYLPGTKGWGATFGGAPTKLWNPQALPQDVSFGLQNNRFGFKITGTPDIPLVVEASTNGAAGSWASLLRCTLTNGLIYFSDAQWTNYPSRFYRLRSP
jgi:BspA type Leucine rich repeat region (6 copies)